MCLETDATPRISAYSSIPIPIYQVFTPFRAGKTARRDLHGGAVCCVHLRVPRDPHYRGTELFCATLWVSEDVLAWARALLGLT